MPTRSRPPTSRTRPTLPPAPAGPSRNVHLVLKDVTIQIAPGVKYAAWAWAGGAPGPVIHVRQGQTVDITLTNDGAIPHSVDFHAARDRARTRLPRRHPGKSFTLQLQGRTIPASSCTTAAPSRCSMHIANGMYGAIVVDPSDAAAEGRQRATCSSPASGTSTPTAYQAGELRHGQGARAQPDWMTFNGYAGQYVDASADRRPRRARPLLGRRRRARRSTPTSTSSGRSSTPRIRSAT